MATNLTTANGVTLAGRTYYAKKHLIDSKQHLVYYKWATKTPLPKNSGKVISLRKMLDFADDDATTALTEGVSGTAMPIEMDGVTATVAGYGRFTDISSLLQETNADRLVENSRRMLSRQSARVVDTLIRDVSHGGTNVIWAGGKTGRHLLSASEVISIDDVRKAARALFDAGATPFSLKGDEYFVCIVDAYTGFDIHDDDKWLEPSSNQDIRSIKKGTLGERYGVLFVKSGNKKRFTADDLIAEDSTNETRTFTTASSNAYTAETKVLAVAEAIAAAEATALAGREIIVNGHHDVIASATAGSAGSAVITLTTGYSGTATDLNGKTVYPGEGGAAGVEVASSIVFGEEAYGAVDLGLNTESKYRNSRIIFHDKEIAGGALEQFATMGWKIEGFAAAILNNDWLQRIESGYTA